MGIVNNASADQRAWVQDAIAACTYDFAGNMPDATITIVTVQGLTNCTMAHTYMCTTQESQTSYLVQIESWADDPNAIQNAGLPGGGGSLHEFFVDSLVHELGHCVHYYKLNTTLLETEAAALFTHRPDGRRGTLADYVGTETFQSWPDKLREGIAEWFRLAFLPPNEHQIYGNRTNWDLSPADYHSLMLLLIGDAGPITGYKWGVRQPLITSSQIVDGETITAADPTLDHLHPTWAWEYSASIGDQGSVAMAYTPSVIGATMDLLLGASLVQSVPDMVSGLRWPMFNSSSPGWPTDLLDMTQHPWDATVQQLGFSPGYSIDHDADAGWRAAKTATLEADLPGSRTAWGVLELLVSGQRLTNEFNSPIGDDSGDHWFDTGGNEVTGSFGFPPWGNDSLIQGTGPTNPLTGNRFEGYVGANMNHTITTIPFSAIANGFIDTYHGMTDQVVVPPDNPAPSPPSSPVPTGHIGSGSSGGYTQDFWKEWNTMPIFPTDFWTAIDVPPNIARFLTDIGWGGFKIDTLSGYTITAWFWPVLPIHSGGGQQPPDYPKQVSPGTITPGPIANGVIRSKDERALAGRQLHIVQRVGGGEIKSR